MRVDALRGLVAVCRVGTLGGAVVLTLAFALPAVPRVGTSAASPPGEEPEPVTRDPGAITKKITALAPFRPSRRPPTLRYDPAETVEAPPPELPPPKPVLRLRGLVWGTDPVAVLEGLPTSPGPRIVRAGDTVGAFTIRSLTPSKLVITGMDTTWTLTVYEPWRG